MSDDTPGATSGGSVTEPPPGAGDVGATTQQVLSAINFPTGGFPTSGSVPTGAGIKIGILSTSFNNLGGAAQDEADGALPSGSDITILKDNFGPGATDEGRAMMQLIHDIAPDATLMFYTAIATASEFAPGIQALENAGASVIVDDFDDQATFPMFQLDPVGSAVEQFVAGGQSYSGVGSGGAYVAAAGDSDSEGYQAPWVPISGTYAGVALTNAESFGGSLVQSVTIVGDTSLTLSVEWDQNFNSGSLTSMELLVFSGGQLVTTATNHDESLLSASLPAGAYEIALEYLSGSAPGLIKEGVSHTGDISKNFAIIGDANAGTVKGHAMASGAITVGAVSTFDTPAFQVSPPQIEDFSASGDGTELLFSGSTAAQPDAGARPGCACRGRFHF